MLTDDQPKETDRAIPRTLDRLGGQGVTFGRAHTGTPLCAPSRASIMSGRYAHHHGVLDTRHPYHLDQHTTVQRQLRAAGYRTGLFGKYLNYWHTGDDPPHFSVFRGWPGSWPRRAGPVPRGPGPTPPGASA
ncbi:sulfatase-like hydrolase/transferase [Streptomyces sp. NPDC048419]|uniref:sulfatase-like hydrolase/transferase n=1 Tax=Streptomyces sp. NPDC048419 TaxID=3365547 RepID=UPI0037169CF2